VFKDTETKTHKGHVTDTSCRPDITAAFDHDWKDHGPTTYWPLIRLAGEKASGGKSHDTQNKNAASYLHYLLLARPDLHVAQGLLTRESEVVFLLGTGGVGIRECSLAWNHRGLYKLLYAFIYRLYEPGSFADPSCRMTYFDRKDLQASYTVHITVQTQRVACPGFHPVYAKNPFGTRTHVLSNPSSSVKVKGKVLTVLKDQLCQIGRRFYELPIIDRVHTPEVVPGVVEAVYGETIPTPRSLGRRKDRLGLQQSGSSFKSIPNPRKMLETLFDLLEGI
jgi:hypothetical protein